MSEINNEVVLKGTEIKPNTFLISGKETAKLDKNTIYQITKIVINECKDNGKPFIYPKISILEEHKTSTDFERSKMLLCTNANILKFKN